MMAPRSGAATCAPRPGAPCSFPQIRANVGILDLDLDFAGCPMFVPEVRANVGVFKFLGIEGLL